MALLANFFLGLFGSLIGFLSTYLSKKIVVGVAVIASFAALFAGFFAAVQGMVTIIQYSIDNVWLVMVISMIWPPHVSVCISTCFSAMIVKWVYVETKERAKAVLYIT